MKYYKFNVLLCCMIVLLLTGCSSTKKIEIGIDSESIVSMSISAYPKIFANGDSMESTTDIDRINEVVNAFNEVTLEYYKTVEEWKNIGASQQGKKNDSITFYNNEMKDIGRITRVTNAEGTFIMKYVEDEVYIVSEKYVDKINAIFDSLIEEAEDGRLIY